MIPKHLCQDVLTWEWLSNKFGHCGIVENKL